MKSFIRAITITIVLNLMLAGSTTAQITPATAPTAPAAVSQSQRVVSEVNKTQDLLKERLIQLNIATTGQFGGGGILVIPTAEIKPQDLVTLMEDMTIMCRIFGKKSTQSYPTTGWFRSSLGFSMPFSRDGRSIKAMYVQGYGAIFLTKVDFLLSPPPEAPEEKETEEEDTDPLWTQMRQEIYAPEEADRRSRTDDRPEEKYDAEKVEDLKATYIIALKHAANIRGLRPDESVILTVTGKVSQSGPLVTRVYSNSDGKYVVTEPRAATGSFAPTVLTIRAKKADIDAFAKGKLSFDQFSQKTQLISYPYLGGGLTSGPSRSSWPGIGSSRRTRR